MARAHQRYRVEVDRKQNRMLIILMGTIRKQDVEAIYTDVRFGVADLQPGFHVVTDMTEAKIAYLAGVTAFKKIARYLQENNVGAVVRIADNPGIIVQQITNLTALINGYTPVYVKTMAEAEEYLNAQSATKLPDQNSSRVRSSQG